MSRVRIPQGLPTWAELNRRCADESRQVASEYDSLQAFAAAAYGGARTTNHTGANISNVAWDILPLTTLTIAEPRAITVDLSGNTIAFDRPGVYAVSVFFAVEIDLDNARSRAFDVRLFDVTSGTPGTPAQCVVPRSSEWAAFSLTGLTEITDAQADDVWRLEVGNSTGLVSGPGPGPVYSTINWDVYSVGTYRGQFGG